MFHRVLGMDLKRGIFCWKFIATIVAGAFLMFISSWDQFSAAQQNCSWQQKQISYGAIDFLKNAMTFDAFKVIVVLLLAGLYTGSFCKEENSRYLRMLLIRTDIFNYIRSKFLANLIIIWVGCIAICVLCCLIYIGFGYPIVSENAAGGLLYSAYYKLILKEFPFLYLIMTGLQFGIIAAMCSSVGILFSSYQSNQFVSVGGSGFLFMILISLPALYDTSFDVLNTVSMVSVLPSGQDALPGLMFIWGIIWPLTVIVICCICFERRMKWRIENGVI